MTESRNRTAEIGVPLLVGVALIGIYLVARASPESTSLGRLARDVETQARALPVTIAHGRAMLRERLEEAKSVFRETRVQSERVLLAQFQEAKRRGSLPPA